jgi:hypothetical protein
MPFEWPLQKVLDVTQTHEKAVKAELYELSWQIAARQQELLTRRNGLHRLMDELAMMDMAARRQQQDVMMKWFAMEERSLAQLRDHIGELTAERTAKVQELARVRHKKDRLAELRDEAHKDYQRDLDHREQMQLDEIYHINFARRGLQPSNT